MSDDDVLGRAVAALRDVADGTHVDSSSTRARVLASARSDSRRRRRAVFAVVALAAVLAGSTAWAAWTGRLPRWLHARAAPQEPVPIATSVPHAEPSAVPAPPSPDPEPPAPASATATPLQAPSAEPGPAAARATPRVPAVDDEQSLYTAAHAAHFVDRDPVAALRGWDRYLAAYPQGHFALEAHYNRAISLVRLGRHAEARAALAPFAEGRYGGYRQSEARVLLDALRDAPGDAGAVSAGSPGQ